MNLVFADDRTAYIDVQTVERMLVYAAPEGETFVGYLDEDTALTSHCCVRSATPVPFTCL